MPAIRPPFIIVMCKGERYIFCYEQGKEDDLMALLIDYALDDQFSFGWPEVRSILRHLGFIGSEKH